MLAAQTDYWLVGGSVGGDYPWSATEGGGYAYRTGASAWTFMEGYSLVIADAPTPTPELSADAAMTALAIVGFSLAFYERRRARQ